MRKLNVTSFEPKPVSCRKPKTNSHIMAVFRCTPRWESGKSNSPSTLPRPGEEIVPWVEKQFSAPRDDTARASCGNGPKAISYHLKSNFLSFKGSFAALGFRSPAARAAVRPLPTRVNKRGHRRDFSGQLEIQISYKDFLIVALTLD